MNFRAKNNLDSLRSCFDKIDKMRDFSRFLSIVHFDLRMKN
eukprot:12060.XXX_795065_795187_1 [CDS] Oithona nana genome sequencing.